VYWNDAAPDASIVPPAPVQVGMAFTVTVNASDLDGDPVYITWERDAGILSVTPQDDGGDGRDAVVVSPARCGTQQLTAYVSDGYGAHDVVVNVPVVVGSGGVPDPPTVLFADAGTQAGGSRLSFTAIAADAGCAGSGMFSWFSPGPGSVDMAGVYTPPATWCTAAGVDEVISVRTLNAVGSSMPASVTVHVAPWGFPNVPQFAASTQTLTAGSIRSYPLVGQRHACDAGAALPLVVGWTVNGIVTPGVSWIADDAGIRVISTDVCDQGTLHATVTYTVAGQSAGPSTLDVAIDPAAAMVPDGGFSMGFMFDNLGTAYGRFSITGVGCLIDAGYTADVVISDSRGVQVASTPRQDVTATADWDAAIPGSCDGGTYFATGTLYPIGLRDFASVTIGRIDAGVIALDTDVDVSCQTGLVAQASASTPPGACTATVFQWEQLSGPPVSTTPIGNKLNVSSDAGFDQLLGETLRWRVTAIAGPENQASAEFSMRLHHHFIALAHAMGPLAAGADDLHTVTAEVTNTEHCSAEAISLDESLDGLMAIASSARVDGDPVDGALTADGHLSIGPFPIAAKQTRRVTYLARMPMFSRPSPSGVARVRGDDVSLPESMQDAVPRSCGCGFGAPPLLWFLTALVGKRWRCQRRR
jgi:hypothetical protein